MEFRDNPGGGKCGIGMINSSSSLVRGGSAFCKPTISSAGGARNGSTGDARTSSPPAMHSLEPNVTNSLATTVAEATDDVSAKYKECLHNHATTFGAHVLDGCGEFMTEGDSGTVNARLCLWMPL
ncbi:zinc-finger homeodomain protein 3-like [Zingiber officinale]|uniref:zinc-finger homeodomain protein 3-like n=1 Tax=Zingiber officinale TaxID=94328 RepID=UPI001C4B0858|nr:zinc-finger homeodomain protein 3-like [Zingiber officinale]